MITNYRLGTEKLEKVRYQNYMKMVASATKINPTKLPPSRRSAWFHSLRTYLQVMEWKTLKMGLQLDPTNWGWKEENEKLVPIMTDEVILSSYINFDCYFDTFYNKEKQMEPTYLYSFNDKFSFYRKALN